MKKLFWGLCLLALSADVSALRNGCIPGTAGCGNCYEYIGDPPPGCKTDHAGFSDFDGDFVNDLLYRNQASLSLQAWMNYGAGNAGWKPFHPPGMIDSKWEAVATGYFSYGGGGPNPPGDRSADILWQHKNNGQLHLWLMDGRRRTSGVSLTCPLELDPCTNPAPPWKAVATGFFGTPEFEFETDGKSDILFWNSSNGSLRLWIMDGADVAEQRDLTASMPDLSWNVVGAGFFGSGNTDMWSDILWYNSSTGEVKLWLMNGPTVLLEHTVGTEPNLNWKAFGVVDLNDNGYPDILFRRTATGKLRVWEMIGPDRVPPPDEETPSITTPTDLNWKPIPR